MEFISAQEALCVKAQKYPILSRFFMSNNHMSNLTHMVRNINPPSFKYLRFIYLISNFFALFYYIQF